MTTDRIVLCNAMVKQEDSFRLLMEQEHAYISAVVRRIIGGCMTEEDVEEAVQDSFMKLWQHAEDIDLNRASVRTYLTAIARNTAKNKLRQLHPNEEPMTELLEDTLAVEGEIDGHMTREQQRQIVNRGLALLDRDSRIIFIRHYFLYEGVAEIAVALDMKPSTVMSRLKRGREKLKRILNKQGYHILSDI